MCRVLRRWPPVLELVLVLLVGCDSEAPGAAGTVEMDAALDVVEEGVLTIVVYADPDGEFQRRELDDPGQDALSIRVPLQDVMFPFDYDLHGGIGGSRSSSWRVTAWVGADSDVAVPVVGDAWGSESFEVKGKGKGCGKGWYCGQTSGVDVRIDAHLAPGDEE